MSTTKACEHTPGPWTNNEKADGTGRRVIHGDAGRLVAVVNNVNDAALIARAPEVEQLVRKFIDAIGIIGSQGEIGRISRELLALLEGK